MTAKTKVLRCAYFIAFLILFIPPLFSQDNFPVAGTVSDASGKPLPNVTVQVKGKSAATSTGPDGSFKLNTSSGKETLIFTFVGFEEQQVVLNNRNSISISMKMADNTLTNVVVVGYGTQKRRNVTAAVSTFNAENLDERPILRVDQALVGQMAGVTVKQSTGVPGRAFTVQVRGTGSITAGNDPLYVLDGFPLATAVTNATGGFSTGNPLDNINPNDIETIQVLKDAAAAAIYGSRASNGVVIITTKRGKTGKPQMNVNAYIGYAERNRKMDMLNTDEFIDRAKEIIDGQWIASGAGRTAAQSNEERRVILGLPIGGINTTYMTDDRWFQPGRPGLHDIDWQDATFQKGLTQNYQLTASGANEFVNYYISGNYTNQEGMIKGLDYTAYSARANVEVKASKSLKFGLNIAPTYSTSNDPGSIEGKDNILHHIVSLSPIQQDAAENVNVGTYDKYAWSGSPNSPVARLANDIGLTKRFRTLGTIFGELVIIKGLTLKSTINLDNTDNTTKTYIPFFVSGGTAAARLSGATAGTAGTSGTFSSYKKITFVNENTLNYNFTIKDDHEFSVLVGAAYNKDRIETSRMTSAGGFTNSVVTTLNVASSVTGTTTETQNVLISYFGRLQYDFQGKYLLSASIRRDGSSRFGSNNPYGTFPSASIGWRVSDENFMKSISFISDLKLRFSYGQSGNYNIGDYNDPVLGSYPYVLNNAQAIGQTASNVANPDLTWETSETKDIGIDFGIIKNRVTGSFDYYTRDNTDLLINSPIPSVTGFTTLLTNAGHVRNTGWEIELNTKNLTGEFQWNTSLNFSHNTNKVISLVGGQNQILIPSAFDINHSILRVGEPMYSIYVVKQTGILTQADIDKKTPQFGKESAGDPKYEDFNGNGTIDNDDRQIVAHPNPDYIWGITNTFRYKGFDLTILIQGQNGGSIYSLFGRSVNRTGTGFSDNVLGVYRDRWRSEADPGNGYIGKALSTFGRIKNTDWLYPSDYVRVRNITLGYNLGKLFNTKVVKGARVYFTLENFFGHDKYVGGFNPEATNTDLSNSTSFPEAGDYGGLPLAKAMIFGVNFTF